MGRIGHDAHGSNGCVIGYEHEVVDTLIEELPCQGRCLATGQAGHDRINRAGRGGGTAEDGALVEAICLGWFDDDEPGAVRAEVFPQVTRHPSSKSTDAPLQEYVGVGRGRWGRV